MNRILFLDFDGVLHPAGAGSVKFSQLGLLADFLREPEQADIRIVVSSTWRQIHSLNRLRGLFPADLQARIVGCTPVLDEYDTDFERGEEIEAWLEERPRGAAWVALDDDAGGFPARLKPHVVFTDGHMGLTTEDVASLRSRLAGAT